MSSLNKLRLSVAIAMLSVSASSFASDEIRLIVKPHSDSLVNGVSSNKLSPMKVRSAYDIAISSGISADSSSDLNGGYERLIVSGGDKADVINRLIESGEYESVEEDIIITNGVMEPELLDDYSYGASVPDDLRPNDPYNVSQKEWLSYTLATKGSSGILTAFNRTVKNKRLRIAVLDSGFVDGPDIDYAQGYNFSMDGLSRSSEYLISSSCNIAHGYAVASIIGAHANNKIGTSGIVDADIIAAQVLNCNSGYMSDAIDGIYWAAGNKVGSAPVIQPVDIINMSISGAGPCSSYMQSAIDFANQKGVSVIVAAGNNSLDSSGYTPSNCKNTIVVAANNAAGNKASFSNYGSVVSVSALGSEVIAPIKNGNMATWQGTSFSAPIVAGIIGLVKQNYPLLTPSELKSLLTLSAMPFSTNPSSIEVSCLDGRCGSGVANAPSMQLMAEAYVSGSNNSIKHVLSDKDSCGQSMFLNHAGQMLKMCELYEVRIDENSTGESLYEVYQVPKGAELVGSNGELITESTESRFVVSGIDDSKYNYGFKVCDSGGECGSNILHPLSTADIGVTPACK